MHTTKRRTPPLPFLAVLVLSLAAGLPSHPFSPLPSIGGRCPRPVYAAMIKDLYHVYAALEEAVDRCRAVNRAPRSEASKNEREISSRLGGRQPEESPGAPARAQAYLGHTPPAAPATRGAPAVALGRPRVECLPRREEQRLRKPHQPHHRQRAVIAAF